MDANFELSMEVNLPESLIESAFVVVTAVLALVDDGDVTVAIIIEDDDDTLLTALDSLSLSFVA